MKESERVPHLDKRISSIISLLDLVFSATERIAAEQENTNFASYLKNPSYEGVKRLISLVKSYGLLQSEGILKKGSPEEIQSLIKYLHSLVPQKIGTNTSRKRNTSTLGASFIKNAYGSPLFGPLRPASPPVESGIILCIKTDETGATTLITAGGLEGETSLGYSGLGIDLKSSESWLILELQKKSSLIEKELDLPQPDDSLSFRSSSVKMWDKPDNFPGISGHYDPLENNFIYYFYAGERIKLKMLRFLSRMMSAGYGIPLRESEKISEDFIQKLPRS